MRRISRATTRHPDVQLVFVDPLKLEMMDLKALRKEVADAERRAVPQVQPSDLRLTH